MSWREGEQKAKASGTGFISEHSIPGNRAVIPLTEAPLPRSWSEPTSLFNPLPAPNCREFHPFRTYDRPVESSVSKDRAGVIVSNRGVRLFLESCRMLDIPSSFKYTST